MAITKKVTRAVRATARTLKKPLRTAARGAEKILEKTEEKIQSARGQTPRRDIAKSPTKPRRVIGKNSDQEVVKAFGKKPLPGKS
jgi:hypothetical protein